MSQTDLLEPNVSGDVGEKIGTENLPGIGSIEAVTSNNFNRLRWINGELTAAEKHCKAFRQEAEEASRFESGDQLDDATRAELRTERRPDTSINIASKYIQYVSGTQRRSPQGLCFQPTIVDSREQQLIGDYSTQAYEWAYRLCNGKFTLSDVFHDMLVTGIGFSDKYLDALKDPRGLISYARIPWEEMLWSECSRPGLAGVRWMCREPWVEKEEAIRRWPKHSSLIAAAVATSSDELLLPSRDVTVYTIPLIQSVPIDKGQPGEPPHRNKVKIAQFQWFTDELGMAFRDPISGETVWLSLRDYHQYEKHWREVSPGGGPLGGEQVHHRIVKQVNLLNRRYELDEPKRLPDDRFTFQAMTGHWDHAKRRWYGFMRLLMDPQRSANVFARLAHEIMAVSAKGGVIVQTDAFKDPTQKRNFKKAYTTPGSVNECAPEALEKGKIKEKSTGEFPAAAMQLLGFCIGPLTDVVTGLPGTSLGVDTSDTSGVTMSQGQQVGRTILASEFDSLALYRQEEGMSFLSFLRLIADGRPMRIGGESAAKVVPLLRRPFMGEYDVWVDDSDHDPNQRQMFQKFLLQAMPLLVKAGMFVPQMFDYMPIPLKIRQAMIQMMTAQQQQQQQLAMKGISVGGRGRPVDPRETQARIAKTQATAQLLSVRAGDVQHKSRRDDFKAIVDALSTAHGHTMDTHRHGIERERLALDHTRQQHEHDRMIGELALKLLGTGDGRQGGAP